MTDTVTLNEFLVQAGGDGPCIGVHSQSSELSSPPDRVEFRTVDGARMPTLESLFDEFAIAWHFPPWFGRNPAAFDDFMTDLDTMIEVALRKPAARGYLTVITDAQLLLADELDVLAWFASHTAIYRDYYRDDADPPAAFALLLTAPDAYLAEVKARWAAVGAEVAAVDSGLP